MASVKVMTVMSGIGTAPRRATHWMLEILEHKFSMGFLSKFQGSETAARLHSNSSGVMVPRSLRRCDNTALKSEALPAVKIWELRAAQRMLYKVTSARASVSARRATETVPMAASGGPG